MGLSTLKVGDVIETPNVTVQQGDLQVSFRSSAGKRFVLLYLGVEDKDAAPGLNVTEVLKHMGFERKESK